MTERFQWDEAKRLSNLDKHGLDFEDVDQLFDADPYSLMRLNLRRKLASWP